MLKSGDQNPFHGDVSHEDIKLDITDHYNVPNITDNAIKNAGEISDAMQFSSKNAASAFTAISEILKGAGTTNDEKRNLIAVEQSKVENDTTLQVFANMAIGMLGSSKEGAVDEKEAPGIEKLSKAFAFLGHKIDDDTDELAKDKRCQDMALAYAGLMTDTEIDEDTKKSIDTAFKQTPDIAKIAQIQEGVENKAPEKLEEVEKTIPTDINADDLKDPSTYDGKNWEDFKSKAIYGAKGAIAIGLLFAPGGIFLAPIFLLATKNLGRNPDDIEKEQKDAEASELESEKASELLNAFKKYLSDPEKVRQNEEKDDSELEKEITNEGKEVVKNNNNNEVDEIKEEEGNKGMNKIDLEKKAEAAATKAEAAATKAAEAAKKAAEAEAAEAAKKAEAEAAKKAEAEAAKEAEAEAAKEAEAEAAKAAAEVAAEEEVVGGERSEVVGLQEAKSESESVSHNPTDETTITGKEAKKFAGEEGGELEANKGTIEAIKNILGGVDSGLVTQAAAEEVKEVKTTLPIGFNQEDKEKFNEVLKQLQKQELKMESSEKDTNTYHGLVEEVNQNSIESKNLSRN